MNDLTDQELRAIKNRRDKDRKKRSKLKKKLRAAGASEELIERIIAERRQADLIARLGEDQARAARRAHADSGPDDTGYEPDAGDPLLRGAGRATGMTAKVVVRGETITDWQYDEIKERS